MNASRILATITAIIAAAFVVSSCGQAVPRDGHATGFLVAFTAGTAAASAAETAGSEDNVLDAIPQSEEITSIVSDAGATIVSSHPRANGAILLLTNKAMPQAEAERLAEELQGVPDVEYVEVEGIAQPN